MTVSHANTRYWFLQILMAFLLGQGALADYCTDTNDNRPNVRDNFCPRLEGTYLPQCCPDQKQPRSCTYFNRGSYTYKSGTSSYCTTSTTTTTDANGKTTTKTIISPPIPCCRTIAQLECRTGGQTFNDQLPLVKRDKACCTSACPDRTGQGLFLGREISATVCPAGGVIGDCSESVICQAGSCSAPAAPGPDPVSGGPPYIPGPSQPPSPQPPVMTPSPPPVDPGF